MSMLNFQRPLNKEAVRQANQAFYNSHPEMMNNGQKQPIHPLDSQHADYRQEWESHYLRYGGQLKKHQPTVDNSNAASNTTARCQKTRTKVIVDLIYIPATRKIYPLSIEDLEAVQHEEDYWTVMVKELLSNIEKADSFEDQAFIASKMKLLSAFNSAGITLMTKAMVENPVSGDGIIEGVRLLGRNYSYIRSSLIKNLPGSYTYSSLENNGHFLDKNRQFDHSQFRKKLAEIKQDFISKSKKQLAEQDKDFSIKYEWKVPDKYLDNGFHRWANQWSRQYKSDWLIGENGNNHAWQYFDAQAEAQFMRFAMGAGASMDFKPMQGKFYLQAEAKSDFALAEAQTRIIGYLPGREGFPLKFQMPLKNSDQTREINLGGVCVQYEMILYGYAGASVLVGFNTHFDVINGALKVRAAIPSDHKNKTLEQASSPTYQGTELKGDFFAGIKAGCDVKGKLRWQNPEYDDSFCELAEAGYGASVSLGAGWSGQFEIGYNNEKRKFYIACEAGLVFGAGASGKAEFVINVNSIENFIQFVYQALRDNDFDYIKLIEKNAFLFINIILVRQVLEQKTIEVILGYSYDSMKIWWKNIQHSQLEAEKIANMVINLPDNNTLKFSPPETKGKLLAILSETFLLSREEQQEDAIIKILEWIQSKRDYQEVLEHMPLHSGDKNSPKFNKFEAEQRLLYILDLSQEGKFQKWRSQLPDKADSSGKVKKQVLWTEI